MGGLGYVYFSRPVEWRTKKLEKRVALSESEDGARPRVGSGGRGGAVVEKVGFCKSCRLVPTSCNNFQPFSNRIIGKYISIKWISWELYKLGTLWPRDNGFLWST
jgi:hypothetical protein